MTMRVLIAGEFSGRVRDAFRRLGHDAVSCDYRPSETPGPHHQGSWFDLELLQQGWDLMIAHPDCTFLVVSGARWMRIDWREEAQLAALHTVKALFRFPIPRIAIENPVGKLSSLWRSPDQILQPYHFGEPFKKTTCLWLKGLPPLVPTNDLGTGVQACWKEPPGPERKKNRARTYQGVADAMAAQWGALLDSDMQVLGEPESGLRVDPVACTGQEDAIREKGIR
jgi:hypothetical protein